MRKIEEMMKREQPAVRDCARTSSLMHGNIGSNANIVNQKQMENCLHAQVREVD